MGKEYMVYVLLEDCNGDAIFHSSRAIPTNKMLNDGAGELERAAAIAADSLADKWLDYVNIYWRENQ